MLSHFSLLGAAIFPAYLVSTVVIGWSSRTRRRDANDFLNATRSVSLPVVAAAFLASNCGALEIVGLSAMAAQYGVQAFHFYWIGAIPGMLFLALWMLPVYRRSQARSLPEYLEQRYSSSVRRVNAGLLAITQLMLAGISLYAIAEVLHVVLGFSYASGVGLSASVVLLYVLLGGLRATMYNEVYQLMVMMAGLAPLMIQSVRFVKHGQAAGGSPVHLWTALPFFAPKMPLDSAGVVLGLGFVLSFSYWGTDFVLMQRALTAKTDSEARQVPLWAGFGKMAFSFLVVLPGLAAIHLIPGLGTSVRYDQALAVMMTKFYGPTMIGLGLTALVASLMSGLAANISAFASVWTHDLYRDWLHPNATEAHYMRVGLAATTIGMAAGIAASGISFYFGNLMEYVQLIFSLFSAPFWAIFLLGMATRRVNARGALAGLCSGTLVGLLHQAAFRTGLEHYGSAMSANFYGAIFAFSAAALAAWFGSAKSSDKELPSLLQFRWNEPFMGRRYGVLLGLAAVLLVTCVWLNVIWR